MTFDRRLIFRGHIDDIRKKATKCVSALYPLIGRKSKLSTANKLLTYKAVIRPVLTYASSIWCTSAISNRKKLQVVQNKWLKHIFNLPWRYPTTELHALAKVQVLTEYTGGLNGKFSERCANSCNLIQYRSAFQTENIYYAKIFNIRILFSSILFNFTFVDSFH